MAASAHTFPAAHALQLVSLLRRFGIEADALLGESGWTERELEAAHARISLDTLRELTARARALTGEPGLGFYLGLQKRLSSYGYPGFAAMHAATVRECIELAVRYAPVVSTGLSLELRVEGELAIVRIVEHADVGEVRDVGVFSLLVGLRHLMGELLGRDPGGARIDIPFPEPEYFQRFAHLLPGARFDQPELRVCFPARGLELPLVAPDRAALNLAREVCERELAELGFDLRPTARVRRLLAEVAALPSIEQAARALGTSSRTLKRKLAEDRTTFSELLEAELRERALRLLRAKELSLEEVAERLGYSTLPNFARAFRRWTGDTPARHRRKL